MGETISIHQAVKRRQQFEHPLGIGSKLMVEVAVAPLEFDSLSVLVTRRVSEGLINRNRQAEPDLL